MKNTILLWGIVIISILLFIISTITNSNVGLPFLLLYSFFITVPITLIISGIQIGMGKGNTYVTLAIIGVISILLIAYLSEGFIYLDTLELELFVVPIIPFVLFFTSYMITKFFVNHFNVK